MADPVETEQQTELPDVSGKLAEAQASLVAVEAAYQELIRERHEMSQKLKLLEAQKVELEKAVFYLTQRDFAITREDIAEMERNGVSFDELLQEAEKASAGPSDAGA